MFRRGNGSYYVQNKTTGKNQAAAQPIPNVAMAKVYLSAKSPELLTRTWGELIELMLNGYRGSTRVRWEKFRKSPPMRTLSNLPIYMTEASHLPMPTSA